jgi:hypothetical protein
MAHMTLVTGAATGYQTAQRVANVIGEMSGQECCPVTFGWVSAHPHKFARIASRSSVLIGHSQASMPILEQGHEHVMLVCPPTDGSIRRIAGGFAHIFCDFVGHPDSDRAHIIANSILEMAVYGPHHMRPLATGHLGAKMLEGVGRLQESGAMVTVVQMDEDTLCPVVQFPLGVDHRIMNGNHK